MPVLLPVPRCALTAPFHPYSDTRPKRFTLCGAVPQVALAGRYPAPLLCGVRTFLPGSFRFMKMDRPAVTFRKKSDERVQSLKTNKSPGDRPAIRATSHLRDRRASVNGEALCKGFCEARVRRVHWPRRTWPKPKAKSRQHLCGIGFSRIPKGLGIFQK